MTGTELTTQGAHKALASMQGGGIPSLIPQTIDEVYRFSQLLAMSGLTPKGIDTPEQVTVQILMGFDLGLKPMQAVQNINVINGRPSIGGDLALAILMGSGLLEEHDEGIDGEGDQRVAWCRVKRKGMKEIERRFSVEDAKRAGLWDDRPKVRRRWYNKKDRKWEEADRETPNEAPWYRYQPRMLCMRARGFAFRDRFSDALKGMHLTEEMIGHEEEVQEAPAQQIAAPPPPPPPPAPEPARPALQPEAPANTNKGAVEIVDEAEIVEATEEQEPFDVEAWLDEVRDRFAEAQTEANVDDVHAMFEDTATGEIGMVERQKYEDLHAAALQRVQLANKPEQAEITGEPGPAPIEDDEDEDDFPGNDAIAETAPPPKTPGEIYIERIREAVADPVRTLESLSGLWKGTKGERQQLVADEHLTKAQVKELTALVKSRWPQEQAAEQGGDAQEEKPAEEDPAAAYDRDFRSKVEACQTVEEINLLATNTLVERNKFSGTTLHKDWTALVSQKRKQLAGIG